MAQRVTGINVRRRRAATKKQREEEARNEIRKLTGQLDVLRGRLTEVTEQREAMTLPNLEGKKVEHSKYGEGTVTMTTRRRSAAAGSMILRRSSRS